MKGSAGAPEVPVLKDLVLLGGGHAHVEVLRQFGMKPLPGVRLTLITKDVKTPYSGMLPGFVAGFYTIDDCHIDLTRVATFARARLIHAAATGIDTKGQKVLLQDRPPVAYDVLSVDVGITPALNVKGASEYVTPVKPISTFVGRFLKLLEETQSHEGATTSVVVGGGAGGVELALALRGRLERERVAAGRPASAATTVKLLTAGRVLASHLPAARRKALQAAQQAGLVVQEECKVAEVRRGQLLLEGGAVVPFHTCLWCTQASPASWVASIDGLAKDDKNFILINECLQASEGPPNIFACGDVATSVLHPRPKAGVFAVRQGPIVADNLRRYLRGQALQAFTPQRSFLSLISTGDKHCIATKGWLCAEGAWLWSLKDWIDRAFMYKYGRDLPLEAMAASSAVAGADVGWDADARSVVAAARMRCGGCGAKVGASILSRVLARLRQHGDKAQQNGMVLVGLDAPDDAAVVRPPPVGHVMIQTVDFFRAIVDDPYIFGRIAANHALGDCHAMGGKADTALAIAVLPFAAESKVEEDLYQIMAGAVSVLGPAGCSLVGGHTCEGAELSLGFCIYGSAREGELLRKGGLKPRQALILTKPLGTGVIMAAAAQGCVSASWLAGALESMQASSEVAAGCLQEHGATACTDVTGFGLLGHLGEMARASKVSVVLNATSVPLLDGAQQCATAGLLSSLHPQNEKAAAAVQNAAEAAAHPSWPLLLDPQTGGGLLAGVPADKAQACVDALRRTSGCSGAAIVGSVQVANGEGLMTITIP